MVRPGMKIGIGIIICLGLLSLGLLWFLPGMALRAAVIEQISGETPQARIAAYVRALARGDEKAVLDAWELPTWELPRGRSGELRARRDGVTRDLIIAGIHSDIIILGIEWWRTCCEPNVINNPRNAGGARVHAQLLDRDGAPLLYMFDVFTREQPYWGEAMGYPPRQWVLRDVYPMSQEPLFWRWIFEPSVRWLD